MKEKSVTSEGTEPVDYKIATKSPTCPAQRPHQAYYSDLSQIRPYKVVNLEPTTSVLFESITYHPHMALFSYTGYLEPPI